MMFQLERLRSGYDVLCQSQFVELSKTFCHCCPAASDRLGSKINSQYHSAKCIPFLHLVSFTCNISVYVFQISFGILKIVSSAFCRTIMMRFSQNK